MNIFHFSVEVQQDDPGFSDARTAWEGAHLECAYQAYRDTFGHRRLIGWLDQGCLRTPIELSRR